MKSNRNKRRRKAPIEQRDTRLDGKFDTQIIDIELSDFLCAQKVKKAERRMLDLTLYVNKIIDLIDMGSGKIGIFKRGITELHKKLYMPKNWMKINDLFYIHTIQFDNTINLVAMRIDYKAHTISAAILIKSTHHSLERFVQRNSANYQLTPSIIFSLLEASVLHYAVCRDLVECQTSEGGIRVPLDENGLIAIICPEDSEDPNIPEWG